MVEAINARLENLLTEMYNNSSLKIFDQKDLRFHLAFFEADLIFLRTVNTCGSYTHRMLSAAGFFRSIFCFGEGAGMPS